MTAQIMFGHLKDGERFAFLGETFIKCWKNPTNITPLMQPIHLTASNSAKPKL
ncbi:hypothetical protein Erwinia_phage_Calisson_00064 [Erwinia phage Calisson]|nr:hypothetical protein Erwinia_phage_Calisson_00064 [Erwinia phage Calisson]